MLRRSKPQKGSVDEPVPHIEIEAPPPIDPLLDLLWEM